MKVYKDSLLTMFHNPGGDGGRSKEYPSSMETSDAMTQDQWNLFLIQLNSSNGF